MPMFILAMALLLPVLPASFASSAPLGATIHTTYGDVRITQIEVIQREWDRPCGFMARAVNSSPVAWENATFMITVSGVDKRLAHVELQISATAEYIGSDPDNWYHVVGRCVEQAGGDPGTGNDKQAAITPYRVDVKLTHGTPDPGDVANFPRWKADQAAAVVAKKRAVAAAATRAAMLAKLPILNSGTTVAFLGADLKCAQQFEEALRMDGLEKRKRIADLVTYGCGVLVDVPVRAMSGQREGTFVLVTIADGKQQGKSGWIPFAWLKQ